MSAVIALNDSWLTTVEAAEVLGVNPRYIYSSSDIVREAVEHRPMIQGGANLCWLEYDVRRVGKLMAAGLTLGMACRALACIDSGALETP